MTRTDFQILADMRIKEAGILLAAGEIDGAYYLAGYGIEFALKSSIITMLKSSDDWQEQRFSEKCWKHDLNLLLQLAALKDDIDNAGPVTAKWLLVNGWTEQSRYENGRRTKQEVDEFYQAIVDPNDGVL